MSDYTPQIGDRVRRTYPDGTIVEGVIARVTRHLCTSSDGYPLYSKNHPEQTELLDRPFNLNTNLGTVYGSPEDDSHRVVRIGPNDNSPWLGSIGDDSKSWLSHKEVEQLIHYAEWVEFDLDGSKK